ncbi:hypothetical protein D9615_005967 [Tricholomella constricta]|uniref:RRM domain-containing protein n=1 Tax=Tricholomella constricta TaxID=117010 RepID=A0A8H5M3F0_9AGAR|nr:hypothetical protein D9615_005967 [Tricholomella constricta]
MSAPSPSPVSEVSSFQNWQNPTNAIKVENISARVAINEVVALFNTLIGGVKSSRVCENAQGGYLEITFFSQDAATKALCMSGYSIQGTNLVVSLISLSPTNPRPKRQTDDRRNLYVLGLPFSITKTDFSNIFSRYGTVTHCVILATVDNSSRRRGFVVMSSHEEAKLAMVSLTRTQIKGHCLDISWAVVQRSQGFLDGGDRALPLDPRMSMSGSFSPIMRQETPETGSANSSSTSISINENELASLTLSLTPTRTLLVTNLPKLLFSQTQDMHPLFYPFGRIKRLNLVETPSDGGSTSVIVEYESAAIAQEAKETLHGQFYAGHQIAAQFVRSKSALLLDLASVSDVPCHGANAPHAFDRFARQSLLGPTGSHYGSSHHHLQRLNNNFQNTGIRAPHLSSSFNLHQRYASRSSSASSRWSSDSIQNSCAWPRYSAVNHVTGNTHHGLFV